MRILFASSECYPLIKTGGLADVSKCLPESIRQLGCDIRIVIPAYRQAIKALTGMKKIASFSLEQHSSPIHILKADMSLDHSDKDPLPIYLIDIPDCFDRSGSVYTNKDGDDWYDNAYRFGLFNYALEKMSLDQIGLNWRPDVLHCNDWPTGLAPALLAQHIKKPATLFTIHNLAYQGVFQYEQVKSLNLPDSLWRVDAMEYYGGLSFLKGGIVFSDQVTTVSPQYACEILQEQYGCGLELLLQEHSEKITGVLNGIDYAEWDPAKDSHINSHYDSKDIEGKNINKSKLQEIFNLPSKDDIPLLACVSRLVDQKGIDLIVASLKQILKKHTVQMVLLGSGDQKYIDALEVLRKEYPESIGIYIGYDEKLAHQIEAGADIYIMPSRYEPCGLNQMYSMRYGTIPVVRNTGGLADTVIDATEENINNRTATGFKFNDDNVEALSWAINKAISVYHDEPKKWMELMENSMQQNFDWQISSQKYVHLYEQVCNRNLQAWPGFQKKLSTDLSAAV